MELTHFPNHQVPGDEVVSQNDHDSGENTSEDIISGEQQRVQEMYRSEVEKLVALVVPEEIGSVDVMLREFVGREEDLLTALNKVAEQGGTYLWNDEEEKRSLASGTSEGSENISRGSLDIDDDDNGSQSSHDEVHKESDPFRSDDRDREDDKDCSFYSDFEEDQLGRPGSSEDSGSSDESSESRSSDGGESVGVESGAASRSDGEDHDSSGSFFSSSSVSSGRS